jgi:hypothetical protein
MRNLSGTLPSSGWPPAGGTAATGLVLAIMIFVLIAVGIWLRPKANEDHTKTAAVADNTGSAPPTASDTGPSIAAPTAGVRPDPSTRPQGGTAQPAPPASAVPEPPTVVFRMKNNDTHALMLAFFSMTNRSRVWRQSPLSDSDIHSYKLSCETGERICYGVWLSDGDLLSPYWGVGRDGRQSCQDCCLDCQRLGMTMALESGDAKRPSPTLGWHFKNETSSKIEVTFYSPDRSMKWPAGDQVFYVEPGTTQDMKLNCSAGQNICYGAWSSADFNRYWGVGRGGRQGCTNCCYICNGGETNILVFNR